MSSGDKNLSFRCIIWRKKIFFQHFDTCPILIKGELVYKKSVKAVSPQITISESRNLVEKECLFHTIHTKPTSNLSRNKKQIKYAFTPIARGIIKSTNEILRKN